MSYKRASVSVWKSASISSHEIQLKYCLNVFSERLFFYRGPIFDKKEDFFFGCCRGFVPIIVSKTAGVFMQQRKTFV